MPVEILAVLSIVAIVTGVALATFGQPARLEQSRDALRFTHVRALLSAITIHQGDNNGRYAWGDLSRLVYKEGYQISTATTSDLCNAQCPAVSSPDHCINLNTLVDKGYLAELPVSPPGQGVWSKEYTGYYVIRDHPGSITVGACNVEHEPSLTVSQ